MTEAWALESCSVSLTPQRGVVKKHHLPRLGLQQPDVGRFILPPLAQAASNFVSWREPVLQKNIMDNLTLQYRSFL